MTRRANWKGMLRVGAVTCPVSLYTAASQSERVAFHTLNRATGHRVRRQYVDVDTDAPVEPDDQVKGYETPGGETVILEPDEIAAVIPDSDKIMDVDAFVAVDEIDERYFDKPYYLTPGSDADSEAFALIRDGLDDLRVAAVARTVIFRRMRSLLIRPQDLGMIVFTLDFDYEVRPSEEAFSVPDAKIDPEMLDLAQHIIRRKTGTFDPSQFDDRYDAALAELVRAKIEGRKIVKPKPLPVTKSGGLLEALRLSAGQSGPSEPAGRSKAASRAPRHAPRRKAG